MLDHGLTLKDRAYALRMDDDLSIRAIALRLGVPKSTVGDWLKGHGETRTRIECRMCLEDFYAERGSTMYCSTACKHKWGRVFGNRPPRSGPTRAQRRAKA